MYFPKKEEKNQKKKITRNHQFLDSICEKGNNFEFFPLHKSNPSL